MSKTIEVTASRRGRPQFQPRASPAHQVARPAARALLGGSFPRNSRRSILGLRQAPERRHAVDSLCGVRQTAPNRGTGQSATLVSVTL